MIWLIFQQLDPLSIYHFLFCIDISYVDMGVTTDVDQELGSIIVKVGWMVH